MGRTNLQTVRSTLAEPQENALKTFSVKKPQQWLSRPSVLAGPTLEKAQSYGQALFEIMSATQAEFAQVAQAQWEAYNRRAQTLIEDVAKNGPAGSETYIKRASHRARDALEFWRRFCERQFSHVWRELASMKSL